MSHILLNNTTEYKDAIIQLRYIKSVKTRISHAVTCMQAQKKHLRSWLREGVRSNQSNPSGYGRQPACRITKDLLLCGAISTRRRMAVRYRLPTSEQRLLALFFGRKWCCAVPLHGWCTSSLGLPRFHRLNFSMSMPQNHGVSPNGTPGRPVWERLVYQTKQIQRKRRNEIETGSLAVTVPENQTCLIRF